MGSGEKNASGHVTVRRPISRSGSVLFTQSHADHAIVGRPAGPRPRIHVRLTGGARKYNVNHIIYAYTELERITR